MTGPSVSVIVVSRGRPEMLRRCLVGLSQLDYPAFEIIVVADPAGVAAAETTRFAERLHLIFFDEPNISVARNLGLGNAAGDVVAFIDDDAVPEPTWLRHLAAPFADLAVAAAGGFVRGRNGISFQSRASTVADDGIATPLPVADDTPQVFDGTPGQAIKTEGTNCAFRRDVLLELGGFDPVFRYFMDETDVNLRLADAGLKTAIVPLAQVHHGFAPSAFRRASRMPRSLHEIAASTVLLLRKRVPEPRHSDALDGFRAEQRARLVRHMIAGTCEPRDVARLMDSLERGLIDGRTRPIRPLRPLAAGKRSFRAFRADPAFGEAEVICGRAWQARQLRRDAAERAVEGHRVSLFLFNPTTLFHRVRFDESGYWEQRGGLFGRAARDEPLIQPCSFKSRCDAEIRRVALVRGLPRSAAC